MNGFDPCLGDDQLNDPWAGKAQMIPSATCDMSGNTLADLCKVIPLINPSDWADHEAPSRQWAWHEYIPAGQATYLTGAGSAGKSLVAQQLCTCIAAGLPFLGVETRQSVAIYLTCEDDADELHRRQKAICAALGVDIRSLAGRLHLVSLSGALNSELFTIDQAGKPAPSQIYQSLESVMQLTGSGFIALDNVAHLFGGNENIRHDVANFVALLNRLAMRTQSSVLFLGHPNKAGQDFSGSTAWENQVRSRLYMEVPRDEDGGTVDPDTRVLTRGKANYARNGERLAFRWHQWAFVRDEDLPPNIAAEIRDVARANGDNDLFLNCLREMARREQAVSENVASRTYAPLVFSKMAEAKGIGKARLEAAMDRLYRIDAIERGFLWRADRKDRFGLREKCADPRADPALTGCADPAMTTRRPAMTHTPISKDITGTAHEAAAPDHEDDFIPGDDEPETQP